MTEKIETPNRCGLTEQFHCGAYLSVTNEVRTCTACTCLQRRNQLGDEAIARQAVERGAINSSAVADVLGVGAKVAAKLADNFIVQDAVDEALAETQAEMVAGLASEEPTQRERELEDRLNSLSRQTQHHARYREFFEAFGGMSLSTHRAIDWHISRDLLAKEQWAEVYQLWSRIDFKVKSDAEADSENPATEIYASF